MGIRITEDSVGREEGNGRLRALLSGLASRAVHLCKKHAETDARVVANLCIEEAEKTAICGQMRFPLHRPLQNV